MNLPSKRGQTSTDLAIGSKHAKCYARKAKRKRRAVAAAAESARAAPQVAQKTPKADLRDVIRRFHEQRRALPPMAPLSKYSTYTYKTAVITLTKSRRACVDFILSDDASVAFERRDATENGSDDVQVEIEPEAEVNDVPEEVHVHIARVFLL